MNESVVSELVAEVLDYLSAGRVGLYEFLWILRSDNPGVAESDLKMHARAALEQLLAEGAVRLVWKKWADADYERDADGVVVGEDMWDDPTEEPYLAVVSVDAHRRGQ